MYSILFLLTTRNSEAAVFVIGISLKGLLVPVYITMSISQGARKKDANTGYVTAPFLAGALVALTLCALEHSWSLSSVGVTRLLAGSRKCKLPQCTMDIRIYLMR